jgi:signal transduction histidine kinase
VDIASYLPIEHARLAQLKAFDVLDTPPEQPFDEIANLAARLCNAPAAAVSLVDIDRLWFKARVGFNVNQRTRRGSFCDIVVTTRKMLAVPDAARFNISYGGLGHLDIQSYLGVPLECEAGAILGTLCVFDTEPRSWEKGHSETLGVLARQVVANLELRKARTEMAHLWEQQYRLGQQYRLARHEEQLRWTVVLRDGLAQDLAGLAYIVQGMQTKCHDSKTVGELHDVQKLVRAMVKQCTALARGHVVFGDCGLRDALERVAAVTRASTGIACTVDWKGRAYIADRSLSQGLLQIAYEAVANAARHAACDHITISYEERGSTITLEVSDDGQGLPPDSQHSEGVGISLMHFRARELGASLELRAHSSRGLSVYCRAVNKCSQPPREESA